MLKAGDRVRMTEALKAKLRGPCTLDKHARLVSLSDDDDAICLACSHDHLLEFQDCIGIVQGQTDYNNKGKPFCPKKVGPEIDVRWLPSNLRYAYIPDDLELVEN